MAGTIRIGIIGSGGIAGAHANAYKQMPEVTVKAVADVIPGKAAEFIQRHNLTGAVPFDDHHQLLELDLDGVSVCTPNVAHHRTSIDALRAGKHVLTEKPMAVTLEQAIEMAEVAKKAGKILTVGFQPRYDPNMQLIKQIVQSGDLGKVYYVETGGGRRRGIPGGTFIRKDLAGAGAMADIGCYSIDLALDALGYPKPLTVSAYTGDLLGKSPRYFREASHFEVEDFGVALVRLEGGVILNFKIAWAMHMDTLGATMFLGTDAGLKVTSPNGVWDGGVESITLFRDEFGQMTDTVVPVRRHNTDRFFEKVKAFVVAIRDGKPAPIPGDIIVRNQAIIDGILRSAATGHEVDIFIPEI